MRFYLQAITGPPFGGICNADAIEYKDLKSALNIQCFSYYKYEYARRLNCKLSQQSIGTWSELVVFQINN